MTDFYSMQYVGLRSNRLLSVCNSAKLIARRYEHFGRAEGSCFEVLRATTIGCPLNEFLDLHSRPLSAPVISLNELKTVIASRLSLSAIMYSHTRDIAFA